MREPMYDLSKEPPAPAGKFPLWIQEDWDTICRKLNPAAWEKKEALRAATQQDQ